MNEIKKTQNWHNITRASLIKPHTSMIALRTSVCMLLFGPTTYYKLQMSTLKYFTKIEACKSQWRTTVRVERRRPGTKMTEVEARVATFGLCFYRPSMVGCSQAVQWTVVEVASGKKTALINARNLPHGFSVKLSPCMYGWRNGWHM